MTDKKKYALYLPRHMWGDKYEDIAKGRIDNIEVKEFEVGGINMPHQDHQYIVDKLLEAVELFCSSDGKIIPIFVFPLAYVLRYSKHTMQKLDIIHPVEVLGPAFKSRDDMFLLNCRNNPPDFENGERNSNGNIKLYYRKKANNITSTILAKAFNNEMILKGSDPIFHRSPTTSSGWEYELIFKMNSDEIAVNDKYLNGFHGRIAAGPELSELFRDHEHELIPVVNLNQWICSKYQISYFPRGIFCCPTDTYNKDQDAILEFWRMWKDVVNKWNKKSPASNNNSEQERFMTLPQQIPCGNETGYKYIMEIAGDIYAMARFLQLVFNGKGDDQNYNKFEYKQLLLSNSIIIWEIYRQKYPIYLRDRIMKEIVFKGHKMPFQLAETYQEFERLVNEFISDNDLPSTKSEDAYISTLKEKLFRKLLEKDPDFEEKAISEFLPVIYSGLPGDVEIIDIAIDAITAKRKKSRKDKDLNEALRAYYETVS